MDKINGAHPRLRGADSNTAVVSSTWFGSSPLTRGGLLLRILNPHRPGLIPAYAGRTARAALVIFVSRAHPRLRGADDRGCGGCCPAKGSSPLTRGGRAGERLRGVACGLIPAYAGRTWDWVVDKLSAGAHPRLRGADAQPACNISRIQGSSPLTRGGPSGALICVL